MAAEYATARVLAESARLADATPRILEAICTALGWEYGALWRVDAEGPPFAASRSGICPARASTSSKPQPQNDVPARRRACPGGSGRRGQPAFIADVLHDDNFPRAPAAAREGLHAAFGFPIGLGDDVLGAMEFFSREIREPDDALLAMLGTIGSQIGQFIERRRAEEELDRFFVLSPDLLCVADFDGYFKRLNPSWTRTLGFTEAELPRGRTWSSSIRTIATRQSAKPTRSRRACR